jgi:hypothetical protein
MSLIASLSFCAVTPASRSASFAPALGDRERRQQPLHRHEGILRLLG